MTVNVDMGEVNTPHKGFTGRMSWPAGIAVDVDASGEFAVDGLNPSKCTVNLAAGEHVTAYKPVTLAAGETFEMGDCGLFASDLGFYIGHEPPKAPELAGNPTSQRRSNVPRTRTDRCW